MKYHNSFRVFSLISRLKWLVYQLTSIKQVFQVMKWSSHYLPATAFLGLTFTHSNIISPRMTATNPTGSEDVSSTNTIPVSHPASIHLETDGKAAGRNFRNVPIHVLGNNYTSLCESCDLQYYHEVAPMGLLSRMHLLVNIIK